MTAPGLKGTSDDLDRSPPAGGKQSDESEPRQSWQVP